jgi:thiosulfate dehydrogenase
MNEKKFTEVLADFIGVVHKLVAIVLGAVVLIIISTFTDFKEFLPSLDKSETTFTKSLIKKDQSKVEIPLWHAPDINTIEDDMTRWEIEYGRELIAHTSKYLGPNGNKAQISNGLNCQNCHLDAGTREWGNNYGSVASTYPKFRARSGSEENIYKRVNDCFQRSLNGKPLDTLSREMQAIKKYIEFLGSTVPKGKKAEGSGLKDLAFMNRAADPILGEKVYIEKCQSCHLTNGEGVMAENRREYIYPPLWGSHSYNDGAGLYRITFFAKYVKYNMPFGVTHENPQLTDEEAWDVAAFVNSQPRPHISLLEDWPDISKKPIDHPFGPYSDTFTEDQHKYGPWKPIEENKKNLIADINK